MGIKWFNKKIGPYLSDRQWGVVREDYSADGDAWDYTTHDQARSKTWRWGEDGIGGISDEDQFLCFAPAFWNGRDPIIKERFFGLTNEEGNHGEDVKELYYYLDNMPDHRYMRMLYKYPQEAFPYAVLVEENQQRSRQDPEFELLDTGIFDQNRYFDIFIEYAKGEADTDILIKITACNRNTESAPLTVLPTLWFRNLWAFGLSAKEKPQIKLERNGLAITHPELGDFLFFRETAPQWLFCENETNDQRLYGTPNISPSCKDGINDFVLSNQPEFLNPQASGTKAAALYQVVVPPEGEVVFRHRLMGVQTNEKEEWLPAEDMFTNFEAIFDIRKKETDEFYARLQENIHDQDLKTIQRQAWAGMLWNKQFYYYSIPPWLDGDPGQIPPPNERQNGRNHDWRHFAAAHILSMPDKWEYPWFAAWDLAFHCIPLARLDAEFAKQQLILLHSPGFQRTDGSIPAYEWDFNDVNPPVQAWAAWHIYEIDRTNNGHDGDVLFLQTLFAPLRAAYNWWLNQKDADGDDLFSGGFLGLDNIGVFDRSKPLPEGDSLEQADATAWTAFYSLQMLRIALELAKLPEQSEHYQEEAFNFFQHFLQIAYAIGSPEDQRTLWDDADGFFYDTLRFPDRSHLPLKVRSIVGLIPMLAVLTLDEKDLQNLPLFTFNVALFLADNPDLAGMISRWHDVQGEKRLLSLLRGHRLKCLLKRMLDPNEFLSPFGIRSLSKIHDNSPFTLAWLGEPQTVKYLPSESDSGMFGGNSNWRGPIWIPINYLLIESLQHFHQYYSDDFQVECPVGSGQTLNLQEVADLLSNRLLNLFSVNAEGHRPLHGMEVQYQTNPHFWNLLQFHEYFDAEQGKGLGASHQTGWTGLISALPQLF